MQSCTLQEFSLFLSIQKIPFSKDQNSLFIGNCCIHFPPDRDYIFMIKDRQIRYAKIIQEEEPKKLLREVYCFIQLLSNINNGYQTIYCQLSDN